MPTTLKELYETLLELKEKQAQIVDDVAEQIHVLNDKKEKERHQFQKNSNQYLDDFLSGDTWEALRSLDSVAKSVMSEPNFTSSYSKLVAKAEQDKVLLEERDKEFGTIEKMSEDLEKIRNMITEEGERHARISADVQGFRDKATSVDRKNRYVINHEFIRYADLLSKKESPLAHAWSWMTNKSYRRMRSFENAYNKKYDNKFSADFNKFNEDYEEMVSTRDHQNSFKRAEQGVIEKLGKSKNLVAEIERLSSHRNRKNIIKEQIWKTMESNQEFVEAFVEDNKDFPNEAKESYVRLIGYQKLSKHMHDVHKSSNAMLEKIDEACSSKLERAARRKGWKEVNVDLDEIKARYGMAQGVGHLNINASQKNVNSVNRYQYQSQDDEMFSPTNLLILYLLLDSQNDAFMVDHQLGGIPQSVALQANINLDTLSVGDDAMKDIANDADVDLSYFEEDTIDVMGSMMDSINPSDFDVNLDDMDINKHISFDMPNIDVSSDLSSSDYSSSSSDCGGGCDF